MGILKKAWRLLGKVLGKILMGIWRLIAGFWRWLRGMLAATWNLWKALGPRWLRITVVVLAVGVWGFHWLDDLLTPNLTQENIAELHYLNEGWTAEERHTFYYAPQGTELLGIEYDWFVNLELPMSTKLLATAENMRGWGFIVDPGQRGDSLNPGNLPVGLGRHIDPKTGREHLDIGCATCHTGELHYKGVALRVDGGQAMQSIADARRGEFITTLGAAVVETIVNPAKWDRFATRVAGDDDAKREQLREDFKAFFGTLWDFMRGPGAPKYYPVEEGRGRTDAVGRIANVVFGYNLDVPDNYRVADAPASYPFIWDIWRFDWVQYTGFTNQAMARNVGEALGVLAPISLVDKDGNLLKGDEFGQTLVDVDGMHCVEGLLRKLEPPRWPERVLGEIDIDKAVKGKDLFMDQCAFCHGPHISKPYEWPVADKPGATIPGQIAVNWEWDMAGDITDIDGKPFRVDWRDTVWALPWISTETIGTDPKLADNFMDNRYDGSKLVPGSEPVNAGNGLHLLLNELVPLLYQRWDITGEAVPDYDGLNVPFRIENIRAYKSRPLHGVWATPPFLHNGSVPSVYDLLSPLRARPATFYVGNREYDPKKLGYRTEYSPGSFLHDTSIKGNQNIGHLFTDVQMPGRIGELLTEEQRYAIIEYLKVMGNPDFAQALGGDPNNWDQYSDPPNNPSVNQACVDMRQRHGIQVSQGGAQ